METKNYRKSYTYADFEDYKRLHFIVNANCGLYNKEANFLEHISLFNLLASRIKFLQMHNCKIADYLPRYLTCGFYTSLTKIGK
jgi:hypothetical protein